MPVIPSFFLSPFAFISACIVPQLLQCSSMPYAIIIFFTPSAVAMALRELRSRLPRWKQVRVIGFNLGVAKGLSHHYGATQYVALRSCSYPYVRSAGCQNLRNYYNYVDYYYYYYHHYYYYYYYHYYYYYYYYYY